MYKLIYLRVRKTHNSKKKIRLIEEHGPYCARCCTLYEDSDSFTIDHIIPRGLGLKQSYYQRPNNRQLLCYPCQRTKAVLEQSFTKRIDSKKNPYVLLLNGHAEDYPNHYDINS
jgi:5-methylcytosine-specific restriction endonuclease McrA